MPAVLRRDRGPERAPGPGRNRGRLESALGRRRDADAIQQGYTLARGTIFWGEGAASAGGGG